MADTIIFGEESGSKVSRESADRLGLANASVDIADVETFVDEYTKISKEANWERMSMSTVQGGALLNNAYRGDSAYDGRYIYYSAFNSNTFIQFDTQGQFTTASDWSKMSMSTAQGAVLLDSAYIGSIFDGRYVYYAPYNSDTFIRFDTKGTSFATVGDWEQISMSTVHGAIAVNAAHSGCIFDGRYIYYTAFSAATFLRFDTQGTSLSTIGDWERMSMSTAQGASAIGSAYKSNTFDGRYVYYTPYNSDTFLRFDTQGTSFTTAADWETMNMSTALGAALLNAAFIGNTFDGRYVYYTTFDSATFLRFDTQGTSFTTVAAWEQMSVSTVLGASTPGSALIGCDFDSRYVYYTAMNSDTFPRFDTQGTSFTTAADWQIMSMSTAQGAVALNGAYIGTVYAGNYVYYTPYSSDTFLRVLATPSEI